MPRKLSRTFMSALLLALIGFGIGNAKAAETKKSVNSQALTFAHKMGIGWNLGNTLEATGNTKLNSVSEYETLWGNPITTKAMFDGIKKSGFNSVRIPVAWSNLMGPNYAINPQLMARVEEVAKYGLDNDMYVIINIHWDGGWITKFPEDYSGTMKKYKTVWKQIAGHFKNYSDHLIFESLNEESNFETLWNVYTNTPNQKSKAYNLLNSVNQEFTDLVRSSGGKNNKRYLLIAGYMTDIERTVNPLFQMPRDPAKRSMVSIHYYTPTPFTLIDKDADWGKAVYTWGTPAEVAAVKTDFLLLKTRFIDKGIPVVMGEFGFSANKDPDMMVNYLSTVAKTAYSMGVVPMLWDLGTLYDRRALKWTNPKISEALARVPAS